MKKLFCILMIALSLCSLAGCGIADGKEGISSAAAPASKISASQAQTPEEVSQTTKDEAAQGAEGIDVDLTKLSSTMVYSEVYNMMNTPDSYIGKTVKMSGRFAYYKDPETENQYFACIIADALACCSQGLEFILAGEHTYPEDYPELSDEITVTGTLEVYEEKGYQFCRLVDAALVN